MREKRPVSAVVLETSGTLLIERGERDSLTVEAADNIQPLLTSEQHGDELVLGIKPGAGIWRNGPMTYHLTMTDLHAIDVSGSGDVTAHDLSADVLTIEFRGSGEVAVDGTAEHQEVTISGSGTYLAEHLDSREATLKDEDLAVDVSGSGNMRYLGSPRVRQHVSGSGDITQIAER